MNRTQSMSRFKKLSRILEVICLIAFWMLLIAGVVMFMTGLFVIPNLDPSIFSIQEGGTVRLGLDGVMRVQADQLTHGANLQPVVSKILWLGSFSVILYAMIWRQVKKILETVRYGTPFASENSDRLKIIGIILLVAAFLVPLFEVFMVASVINSGIVPGLTATYQMDYVMLLIGLLVLVLSGIFRYGYDLQLEVDETV